MPAMLAVLAHAAAHVQLVIVGAVRPCPPWRGVLLLLRLIHGGSRGGLRGRTTVVARRLDAQDKAWRPAGRAVVEVGNAGPDSETIAVVGGRKEVVGGRGASVAVGGNEVLDKGGGKRRQSVGY